MVLQGCSNTKVLEDPTGGRFLVETTYKGKQIRYNFIMPLMNVLLQFDKKNVSELNARLTDNIAVQFLATSEDLPGIYYVGKNNLELVIQPLMIDYGKNGLTKYHFVFGEDDLVVGRKNGVYTAEIVQDKRVSG